MEKISFISGRLEIQNILTEYYKTVLSINKDDLFYVIYLSTASIYPEYKNKQLNLGDKIIYDVLCECTGRKLTTLRSEFAKVGDFGTIGMNYRAPQLFISKKRLLVGDVIRTLRDIAEISGPRSKTIKTRKMLEMISICSPLEIKYLFRIFEERLKVKIAFKTVLISFAKIFSDDVVEDIKEAYNRRPDIEELVKTVVHKGIESLKDSFDILPGIPVKPMLSQPSKNISCAFKKVENKRVSCEFKYDGERIQIHRNKGSIKLYSRNLEETTNKYIDIEISTKEDKDFIIDAEVVAYDTKEKKLLSFQTLSTRKRKDTKLSDISVNICLFAFDIIFFDSESLIERSLSERREVLYHNFNEIDDKFYFAEHVETDSIDVIEGFFKKSVDQNFEGLMIKILDEDAKYIPSKRSNSWIKLKKDYIDNFSDSFDLVVLGAYYGKGKRTGVYGGFLLGAYNDEDDIFETVCKIGTGFDDETLSRLYEELNNFTCEFPKGYKYKDQTVPDVWIQPKFVWEVRTAGISLSPIYCAGITDVDKGLSLRFPRFLNERDDKIPREATTSKQICSIYKEYSTEISDLEE